MHLLLDLDWRLALLYGAVLSSTDAAAVFATLRRLRLPPRLVATLEAESGINDAPVVLLVVLLSATDRRRAPVVVETLLVTLRAGRRRGDRVRGRHGRAVGAAPRGPARRRASIPIAAVGLTVLAYAAGAVAHASGFLAVYVAGVVLGNARLPHRQAILGFADGLAWLAQIGLFVLLGLLASPDRLADAVVPALVVGLVAGASSPARCRCWSRATPFRMRPARAGVPVLGRAARRGADRARDDPALGRASRGATRLFDVVFVLVLIFTLVQAATIGPVARLLGVTAPGEAAELRVETAPLERMGADLLQLEVPPGSKLAGVHLDELRLPVGASVTLVLRDGAGFVPAPGHPAQGRRQPADRGHGRGAGRRRAPAARGQPARPVGAMVRRVRPRTR